MGNIWKNVTTKSWKAMKTNKNISKYLVHVIVSKLNKNKCLFKHFEVEQNIYRLLSYSKVTSTFRKSTNLHI